MSVTPFPKVAQKAVNVHMITAHMDTMNAAAALLTDSVTIMLTTIETVHQCLLLLAQEVALLGEALRHRTHILTLEFEIPSPSLTPHGVTCTEMTEEDVLIERTIIVGADHLTPRSLDTHPHSGLQDRTLNLLIPPRERHYLQEEAHDLSRGVDLQVLTRSAAPAAQAAAVIPTAPQVMALGHAPFSLQPHMHRLSHLW